jgi:hypothetical protein
MMVRASLMSRALGCLSEHVQVERSPRACRPINALVYDGDPVFGTYTVQHRDLTDYDRLLELDTTSSEGIA